jgi:exodeoxyribonuclease VII large subunit
MTINHPDPMATEAPLPGVLTVSQLHHGMRAAFAAAGLEDVWVGGVVTGLRRGPRFCSLELVEYGDEAAEVRAVLSVGAFPRQLAEIDAVLRRVGLQLADGLEVSLRGRLDSNPGFGRLRLLAQTVDPRASIGAAVLARDRVVVAELEASGELAAQQALALPELPRRIGLVSSPVAAGRADVLAVLERLPLPVEVVEASAAMGGAQAPREVAGALAILAGAGVDVVVIARGGGARSDLAPWDSAELARAIARCPVPVWVALGHAQDRTVADMAAHRSHPTPSAAAAALVAGIKAALNDEAQAIATRQHDAELAMAQRRMRYATAVAVAAIVVVVLIIWAGLR